MDEQSDQRYRMRQMSEVLNLSRSSLIYYESIGLVSPDHREGGGYREYGDQEIFDLFSYGALRNVGFSGKEVTDLASGHDNLFDDEVLDACLERIDQRAAYTEAQRDAVLRIKRLLARRGEARGRLEDVERWLFFEDGSEQSYHQFAGNDQLDLLVGCAPISGFGALYVQRADGSWDTEWGRTIPERWTSLVGIDAARGRVIGGCPCYTKLICAQTVRGGFVAQQLGEVKAELRELGYRDAGPAFMPYAFPPASENVWVRLCVPVEG